MDGLLSILAGISPLPPTRFVGYDGHINEDSWKQLVNALRTNKNALGVRLRGCGLKCPHAGQLAEVLVTNTTLEVLELPDNEIDEAGVQALVDTLRLNNSTLKSVDLSGNPCLDTAPHVLQELDTLMKRNRVIKKLPKTPVGSCGGARSMPCAGAPAATTASTPSKGLTSPQPLHASTMSTGLMLRGVSFEVEQRLQHLEEAEATIRSELDHVRSFSSQSEVWQKKIDAAGQQIAAILSLVDSRNTTLEARLQAMELWRAGAEQAWASQSKVLEDMAGQLLRLMHRVQTLEGQIEQGDSASRPIDPVQAVAAAPPALAKAPDVGTLWRSLQLLTSRLEKLESQVQEDGEGAEAVRHEGAGLRLEEECVVAGGGAEQEEQVGANGSPGSDTIGPARSSSPVVQLVGGESVVTATERPKASSGGDAACGLGDGRDDHQLAVSTSLSELSTVDASTPEHPNKALGGSPRLVGAGVGSTGLSPSPIAPGGDGGEAARWRRPSNQRPENATSANGPEGLRSHGDGDAARPLEAPGSPIMWHVNTFAAVVTSGSDGLTPLGLGHDLLPPAAASASSPLHARESPKPSGPGSAQESLPSQGDGHIAALDASCSHFVMYATAARRASDVGSGRGASAWRRYSLARQDSADSITDLATKPQDAQPLAAARGQGQAQAPDGGQNPEEADSGSCVLSPKPLRVAVPAVAGAPGGVHLGLEGAGAWSGEGCSSSPPGTPQASTFSVDAETVSLSVAFAGSAARPRAPAAATTSDVSPMTLSLRTKDPSEGERDSATEATTTTMTTRASIGSSGAEGSISVAKAGADVEAEAGTQGSGGSSNFALVRNGLQCPAAGRTQAHSQPSPLQPEPQPQPPQESPVVAAGARYVVQDGSAGREQTLRAGTTTPRGTWGGAEAAAAPSSRTPCSAVAAATPCVPDDALTPTSRHRPLIAGAASGTTDQSLPRAAASSVATIDHAQAAAPAPPVNTNVTPRSAPGRYIPNAIGGGGVGTGNARSPMYSSGVPNRDPSRGTQAAAAGLLEPHRQHPGAATSSASAASLSSLLHAAAASGRLPRPGGGQAGVHDAGRVTQTPAAAQSSAASSWGVTGHPSREASAAVMVAGPTDEGGSVAGAGCRAAGAGRAGGAATAAGGPATAAGGPATAAGGAATAAGGQGTGAHAATQQHQGGGCLPPSRLPGGGPAQANGPHSARQLSSCGDSGGPAAAKPFAPVAAASRSTHAHPVAGRQPSHSHGGAPAGAHRSGPSSGAAASAPFPAAAAAAGRSVSCGSGSAAVPQDVSMRRGSVYRSRKPEEGSSNAALAETAAASATTAAAAASALAPAAPPRVAGGAGVDASDASQASTDGPPCCGGAVLDMNAVHCQEAGALHSLREGGGNDLATSKHGSSTDAVGEGGGGNVDVPAPCSAHPHVSHCQHHGSSRILKAGVAVTSARALTSGTAVNSGPVAKGPGASRGGPRNVTSVAGTTKRWM